MQSRSPTRRRRAISLALVVVLLVACNSPAPEIQGPDTDERLAPLASMSLNSRDLELWDVTVRPYLEAELWRDRDLYDAGQLLMAPLEAAFRSDQSAWQQDFASHFARFIAAAQEPNSTVSAEPLSRLQYVYLAARFVRLATQSGRSELVPPGLVTWLLDEVEATWLAAPSWQWDAPAFNGVRERIQWKLDHESVEKSYYRALVDEDLFTLAIGSELRAWERESLTPLEWSPVITDIVDIAYEVIQRESSFPGDGWLFQVGVWADHPDFAYAGHASASPGMEPLPKGDVAADSSHSARWGVWLRSLRDAHRAGDAKYREYDLLLDRLANQLVDTVLSPPSADYPYLRMTNYMDGWNGLYRWNYSTTGEGRGYGPWELSGSLMTPWWGLVEDRRVAEMYCSAADHFPLSSEALSDYVGPNTTRERHPLASWPAYFTNGFAELNVRLACRSA